MKTALRKRATWGDLIVGAAIAVLAAALTVLLISRPPQITTVQVILDQEVVYSCRLNELEEPVYYTLPQAAYPLTLEFSRSGVRVAETACPGEDCRHMGTVSTTARQIICLPNRLVVVLKGSDSSYDAITG